MRSTTLRPNAPQANHFLMREASWNLYQTFIQKIGDGTTRVTYSDGRMEIMSPLLQHEKNKKLIARLVETMTEELEIVIGSLGSTTYSEQTLEKGLEPDECYYIANEARVRGKDRIDLTIDPPPDLAMEIDMSYRAIDRESIYAAIKVPEVWRYDGEVLECLVLNDQGTFDRKEFSRSFPFLRVGELKRFMNMIPEVDENTMLRAFREWVRGMHEPHHKKPA